jgi:lipoprotein-anchoring transpeptidase ErfK/SrfK
MRINARMVVPLTLLTVVVVGCSPDDAATSPSTPSATEVPAITNSAEQNSPTAVPLPTRDTLSQVATAKGRSIDVFSNPNKPDFETIRAADVLTVPNQTPLVFLVKTVTDGWLQVWLPVRPNGSTAWVRERDVTVADTRYWIDVSLSDFTLKVYDDEDMVFETAIGVGQDEMPTPGGTYYIRELLQPPNPNGIYGPYAYGLSGYSPVLDSFKGGDAVIGIHGTDTPSSIGGTVSHGCIRMPNDSITQIVNQVGLPLGTPVYINT